jgi:endonuclease-3
MVTEEKAEYIFEKLKEMHPDARCELIYKTPYELLVAVILSAQCTDKRVNVATEKLFADFDTPEKIAALGEDKLKPYIYSCGFYNGKAHNIVSMSKELVGKYGGEVPVDFDKLTALPGVGRKTASVVLSVAFGIPAMPVDTHVFRVSKRLKLSDGGTVGKVEEDLRGLFDKKDWNKLHHSLIFHGRYICHSRNPNCAVCLLKGVCGYAAKNK